MASAGTPLPASPSWADLPGRRGRRPQLHPDGSHRSRRSAHRRRGGPVRHRCHRRCHQHHHEARSEWRQRELLARRQLCRRRRHHLVHRKHRLRSHDRLLLQHRGRVSRARAHRSRRRRSARHRPGAHRSGPGRQLSQYQHAVRARLSVSQQDLRRRGLRNKTGLAERRHSHRR